MKRIVVCFDGTGNGRPDRETSNAGRLSTNLARSGPDGTDQIVLYLPGVGSNYRVDQYLGGAFGLGLMQAVKTGYKFLVANYDDGDDIFLFGFSRGAFSARSLASMLDFPGLLLPRGKDFLAYDYATKLYETHSRAVNAGLNPMEATCERPPSPFRRKPVTLAEALAEVEQHYRRPVPNVYGGPPPAEVAFLGVFDTVGALGRSGHGPPGSNHNLQLPPRVRTARQALAIDEHRLTFSPEIWRMPEGSHEETDPDRVKQVWFEGAHSDIGGGADFPTSLSSTVLLWMLLEAHRREHLEVAFGRFDAANWRHPYKGPQDSLTWWYRVAEAARLVRQKVRPDPDPSYVWRDRVLKPDRAWNIKIASSALTHHRGGHVRGLGPEVTFTPYSPASLSALEAKTDLATIEEDVIWLPYDTLKTVQPDGLVALLPESFTHASARAAAGEREEVEHERIRRETLESSRRVAQRMEQEPPLIDLIMEVLGHDTPVTGRDQESNAAEQQADAPADPSPERSGNIGVAEQSDATLPEDK